MSGFHMDQASIERAIQRAHRRGNYEARQIIAATSDRARRAHERHMGRFQREERDAILTYQAFGYDLEGGV